MITHRRLIRLGGAVAGPIAACALLGAAVCAAYVGQALLLAAVLSAIARRDLADVPPLLAAAVGVVLCRALLLWWREVAIAAAVFLVLLVAVECFRPVRDLAAAWHAGYLGVTAVDGIEELLTAPAAVRYAGQVARTFRGGPAITFDGVTYRYRGRPEPAIRDVTLRLAPGETVVVVGRSGAGKSTLANLLLRHLEEVTSPGLGDPNLNRSVWMGAARPARRADRRRIHRHPAGDGCRGDHAPAATLRMMRARLRRAAAAAR
ncbi:ATP-binding cassette domain-containing protein [Micromonospora sp. CPCC 206061]|uniref:ATP-binding cassette domain-containing protein n=1 Tax=Micromonospora sp. CPCC 206061 TaxID=3122410 RepID=UPI002FF2D2E0